MAHNNTLDFYKGYLILLVVIGHIISGGELTSGIKEYIYQFHMAVFFAISGYLLKAEQLKNILLSDLIRKYFFRLGIPFLFGFLIYSLFEQNLLSLLYPWNHLWFIPAYFIFIIYTLLIEKLNINRTFVLFASLLFTLIYLSFEKAGANSDFLYYMGDKRYYYFFCFMFLGYYLKNYSNLLNNNLLLYLSIFLFILANYVYIFGISKEFLGLKSITFMVFNISFIFIHLSISTKFINIKLPIVNMLGIYTLPIYMWHIFPIIILNNYIKLGGFERIGVYFLMFILMVILIQNIRNNKLSKILIFGESK